MKPKFSAVSVFLFVSAFLSYLPLDAIDLSKENCNYWYQPGAAVQFDYQVYEKSDSLIIEWRLFTLEKRSDSIQMLLQKDFNSVNHLVILPRSDTLVQTDHLLMARTKISQSPENVFVLSYKQSQVYYFPIPLKLSGIKWPGFGITQKKDSLPVFNHFLKEQKYFLSEGEGQPEAYVFRYQENFAAADPPMMLSAAPSPALIPDSIYRNTLGELIPESGFIYLIQTDTLKPAAVTYYSGDSYYPKLVHMDEIIEPLVYIARQTELRDLRGATDRKKEFDRFWLSLYPIKRNAADAISAYYQRVTAANALFSSYKPGWKTDRGMIFTVMGTPDRVTRSGWKESWTYANKITFEFVILSTLFAPQQYVLMRDSKHEESWVNTIRILRNNQ